MAKRHRTLDPLHQQLVQAIAMRTPISAVYHGLRRVFCPHVFGFTSGHFHALMYQSGGESVSGLGDPAENWRCVRVDELSEVAPAAGDEWVTPENWTVVDQRCVSEVIASVFPSGGAARTGD